MNSLLKVPFLGVNDTECTLVDWRVREGESVRLGQVVASVETTKAVLDVEATGDGVIYPMAAIGARHPAGAAIAVLAQSSISDPASELIRLQQIDSAQDASQAAANEVFVTKKAQLLIAKYGLDQRELIHFVTEGRISEESVTRCLQTRNELEFRRGLRNRERVGIIGGVGGGGALIVVESMFASGRQQPIAIFDKDPAFRGKSVLGVPVHDRSELAAWHADGRFDSVVIAFNRDLVERARVFEELTDQKIRFTNVIDHTAELRYGIEIGTGNIVLGRAYIGACSEIGDNNFISANVHLEHGNRLGSHIAFGPGVFTSGNVTIGSRVRFATGIFVEPAVHIGDDSIIASGAVIRADVPASTTVRVHYQQSMKHREESP